MKNILLSLLFYVPLLLNANMASPIQAGTLVANPFLNQYVQVLHENIFIKIDESFQYANFEIEYQIYSEKDGLNIPLLFYAYQYEDDFKVTLDGKEIKLKEITKFWNLYSKEDKEKFKNYNYLYQFDQEEIKEINDVGRLKMNDFLYFETDISKGNHNIKISYKASRWLYKHSRLNEYSFKYVLSPAKYWKSFGSLNIKIDASNYSNEISTNLGKPKNGSLDKVATFNFTEMPVDIINITLEPKLSDFTKLLLKIGYFGIALLFMIPLIYFHYRLMKKYRKQNSTSKLSAIAIIGGILLPIIFIFVLIFSSFFIDYFLGKHASGREGYGAFFMFFFLPKFWLYYLPIVLITDYLFKRKNG